jgi:tryptophanyl-tRNA synthetase
MKIETDSTPLEEPKDPDSCNVFALYSLLANKEQIEALRAKYLGGNYGYGHAKQELFELIVNVYQKEREMYWELMENKSLIDEKLKEGAKKAKQVAIPVLKRVREKLGFRVE